MPSESKASPRRVEAAVRQQEALQLRLRGQTYREIAEATGYASESGARKAVETALQAIRDECEETAEEVRSMELQRLDKMLDGVWSSAIGGDPKGIEAALKIMDRRAKLLGLDRAQKREITGPDGRPLLDLTAALLEAAEAETSGGSE